VALRNFARRAFLGYFSHSKKKKKGTSHCFLPGAEQIIFALFSSLFWSLILDTLKDDTELAVPPLSLPSLPLWCQRAIEEFVC